MHLHPTSALIWGDSPSCVLFHEAIVTSKHFMRHVVGVKSKWVKELLPSTWRVDVLRLSGRKEEEVTVDQVESGKSEEQQPGQTTNASSSTQASVATTVQPKKSKEQLRAEKIAAAKARLLARRKQQRQ